jgi:uncharacterized membrane protein
MATAPETLDAEPRWPVTVALLAVGGLYLALPESLTVGPDWLVLVLVVALLLPTVVTYQRGRHGLNQIFGYILLLVVTAALVASLVLLVGALLSHKEEPKAMLRSAVALWFTNILVFAGWYWRLDGGGPYERDLHEDHTDGAFLFPQMTRECDEPWRPGFVDYLFLAFNTSTAFSPTDVPVLSRWAKLMMMVQSTISLTTVALLAARAVNIL